MVPGASVLRALRHDFGVKQIPDFSGIGRGWSGLPTTIAREKSTHVGETGASQAEIRVETALQMI
jgi:hypothetical protein